MMDFFCLASSPPKIHSPLFPQSVPGIWFLITAFPKLPSWLASVWVLPPGGWLIGNEIREQEEREIRAFFPAPSLLPVASFPDTGRPWGDAAQDSSFHWAVTKLALPLPLRPQVLVSVPNLPCIVSLTLLTLLFHGSLIKVYSIEILGITYFCCWNSDIYK